jgi:hypothetical protein
VLINFLRNFFAPGKCACAVHRQKSRRDLWAVDELLDNDREPVGFDHLIHFFLRLFERFNSRVIDADTAPRSV